ncbi:MAG: hydroxylamine reductase [Dethiobacter sp.]|jgi:hydroxylamine reductase|nr:hydroxylamine reductase [Dethiobacter sp.]MCL4464287.1 hydroxylamine reductase [Bacillota bacterium]MCL5993754.1 hydroxylamine reductase [Bacillota bacterium]
MFCNQCEQTAKGVGCTTHGVCGKDPDVSALQDLLLHALMGLSLYAEEARKNGITDTNVNRFTAKAIFSTLTNVDFDPAKFQQRIAETVLLRQQLKAKAGKLTFEHPAANFAPATDIPGLVEQGKKVGLLADEGVDADIRSLQQILRFGIKGVAAYIDHAAVLGQEDDKVYAFLHEALSALTNKELGINELLGLVLKCGEINFRAMELLDAGNTGRYGHPVPTEVPLGHIAGKAILVSGHDLKDLDELLKQTAGKGITVYTHGEMLPTHGYPELKKYQHFYGHYGTAWQNQQKEFANFPGAILMTTNCLQKPQGSYLEHIFTTGNVGWPGVSHLDNYDFTPVIEKALAMQGFPTDEVRDNVLVGFGRNTVLGVAPKVIDAVKNGDIKHFFLVGGCDGAKPGRSYYSDFVEMAPKDTVILTLACGKFRFFDKKLGDIGGIPRLLDVGQCNDSYSAIQIALALANAFECDVNELPLTLVLSWYEQKAVAILLTLLHLGLKDIYLGPSLPAFITPNVLNVLVEKFNLHPISTPENDLAQILG